MARLETALPIILKHEGVGNPKNPTGYVNHPKDPGGETNYGITKNTAIAHGYSGDMKAIPMNVVERIYLEGFWRFDKVNNQAVANKIFDMCVNMSPNRGVKLTQRIINRMFRPQPSLIEDGLWGSKTEAAINTYNASLLLMGLCVISMEHYSNIVAEKPTQAVFLKGWTARAAAGL